MGSHMNFVSDGAMLKCMFGAAPATLVVLPTSLVNIGGNQMATIMDFEPLLNIGSFEMCSSVSNPTVNAATAAANGVLQPMPCIPATSSPWTPGEPTVLVGKLPALTKDCICMCNWAGMIQITDSGVHK